MRPAILAVLFALAFALLFVTAILSREGQQWDAASLQALPELRGEEWMAVYRTRDWLAALLVAVAIAAEIEGTVRRRWTAVLAAASLMVMTAAASHVLKRDVLPRPALGEFGYALQTFPSGHAAISLAAVVAVVWLGPRWLRPAVTAALGVIAAGVALMSVLSLAHRGSDVLGGTLLTAALASAISVISGVPRGRRARLSLGGATLGWSGIAVATTSYVLSLAALRAGETEASGLTASLALTVAVGVSGVIAVVLLDQRRVSGSAHS